MIVGGGFVLKGIKSGIDSAALRTRSLFGLWRVHVSPQADLSEDSLLIQLPEPVLEDVGLPNSIRQIRSRRPRSLLWC